MSLPAPFYRDDLATIYHGDARKIMAELPDESFDVLFMDPPYGHSNAKGDLLAARDRVFNDRRPSRQRAIANDSPDRMRRLLDSLLREAARVLKSSCCCCCCCCCGGGPRPTFAWLAQRMDAEGLAFFHSTIWDKKNGLGWKYRRHHEMVLVSHRRGGKLAWNEAAKPVGNVFRMAKLRTFNHPNEKPLELVAGFLARHCPPGGIVIDPCMGSGTTLVAAKMLGLRCVGIDTVKRYCAKAASRCASILAPAAPGTPHSSFQSLERAAKIFPNSGKRKA